MSSLVSLKAMAEAHIGGVGKQTTFKVDPRIIKVEEGFNARPLDMDHVEAIKKAKRNGAIMPPLFVRVEEGSIILVDGHHRLAADLFLIGEGAQIETTDVIQFRGNDADRTMHMVTSASGKPLAPLQLGIQYRKMLAVFGWTEEQIAARAGKSKRHVTDMLALAESNSDVHALINGGKVAAHVALKVVKEHGANAGAIIKGKLAEAGESGKAKVTNKTMRAPKAESRDKVLLCAAYLMLNEIYHSEHADALGNTVLYDDAQCDGKCLMNDIKNHLNIKP